MCDNITLLVNDSLRYLCQFLYETHSFHKFNTLVKFAYTCKRLYTIIIPVIYEQSYCFNLYQLSIEPPDMITANQDIYPAIPIGNFMWLTKIKTHHKVLNVVPCNIYNRYDGHDRVFESGTYLFSEFLVNKNILLQLTNTISKYYVSIHYHANFGEFIQIVWWYKQYHCSQLQHVRLVWTEGDVWIGQLILPCYSTIEYHYEVCVDHGGPVIKIEDVTRIYTADRQIEGTSDVWNMRLQLLQLLQFKQPGELD